MKGTCIPIGPYHPLLKEPEHLKLYVEGEKILNVEFFLGYNHRGIEKLAESRSYDKVIYLVERICGICSNTHNSAFTKAVERAAGLEPSKKAKMIRSIMSEFERIQSHLLCLAVQSNLLGFDTLFMHAMTYREDVLETVEKISGARRHYGVSEFGGVRKDITKETAEFVRKKLGMIKANTQRLYEEIMSNDPYVERLKGIGVLKKKRAEELGVVGPVARGSGLKRDIREIEGYDAYYFTDFKVVRERKGDSLSRTIVRLKEIFESIEIINQLLDLPEQDYRGKDKVVLEEGIRSVARVEAPRGENFHYLLTGKTTPKRLRIRPPTYANFIALPEMLAGEMISDAASVVISLDPCFSCTDRACVIDVNSGEEKIITFQELVRKC